MGKVTYLTCSIMHVDVVESLSVFICAQVSWSWPGFWSIGVTCCTFKHHILVLETWDNICFFFRNQDMLARLIETRLLWHFNTLSRFLIILWHVYRHVLNSSYIAVSQWNKKYDVIYKYMKLCIMLYSTMINTVKESLTSEMQCRL